MACYVWILCNNEHFYNYIPSNQYNSVKNDAKLLVSNSALSDDLGRLFWDENNCQTRR